MKRLKQLQRLTAWLLVISVVLQPVAHLAVAETERMDRDAAESAARDFREKAEDEANERGVQEHGGAGAYHGEYTDRDGSRHEFDVERQVEVLHSDGFTAVHEAFRVTTHDIPAPREAQVGPSPQTRPDAPSPNENDKRPFHGDLEHLSEYSGAIGRAQPESHNRDIPSRIELEAELTKLNAATVAGAAVTDALSAQLSAGNDRFDQIELGFEPPEMLPDESGAPEQLHPLPYDPRPARSNTITGLDRAARESSVPKTLDAISQAVNLGLISEIGRVLTPRFVRLGAFLTAHYEELRAGAELAVDIAVTAIPVASVAWGLANLASIAARGTTVMGTPLQGGSDVALVVIGAVAPALPIKRIAQALKNESVLSGLIAKAGKVTTGAGTAIAKTIAKTNSPNLAIFLAKAAQATVGRGAFVQKIYDEAALARMAARYPELETRMAAEAGTRLEVNETRAIMKEYMDGNGVMHINTEADVFTVNGGNSRQNHRFSLPGNEALYSSTGPSARETVMAELMQPSGKLLFSSRTTTYERILDLTDPSVRSRIGVTEEELRSAGYEITHEIGDLAKQLGFDAIRAPSTKGTADNIIRLVHP